MLDLLERTSTFISIFQMLAGWQPALRSANSFFRGLTTSIIALIFGNRKFFSKNLKKVL